MLRGVLRDGAKLRQCKRQGVHRRLTTMVPNFFSAGKPNHEGPCDPQIRDRGLSSLQELAKVPGIGAVLLLVLDETESERKEPELVIRQPFVDLIEFLQHSVPS